MGTRYAGPVSPLGDGPFLFICRAMPSFKPGVSIKTHLMVAAALWSGVGLFLFSRGALILLEDSAYFVVLAGIVAGTLKSLVVLDKTAAKNVRRILQFGESTCIGGVYSWKTWLLVVCMIVGGRLLRHSSLPSAVVGVLYVAVGWALLFSSRKAWKEWCG